MTKAQNLKQQVSDLTSYVKDDAKQINRLRSLAGDMYDFLTELMGSDSDDSPGMKDFAERLAKFDEDAEFTAQCRKDDATTLEEVA